MLFPQNITLEHERTHRISNLNNYPLPQRRLFLSGIFQRMNVLKTSLKVILGRFFFFLMVERGERKRLKLVVLSI